MTFDVSVIPTPCYVCEESKLKHNLRILARVQQQSGCKIILALKGFAMWSTFPLIREVLYGATASSLDEARLAFEEMGREVHTYAPVYRAEEFEQILTYSDHIVFNSLSQWQAFKEKCHTHSSNVSCGIRVNPEYSEIEKELYDPCGRYSRLGVVAADFHQSDLKGIEGIHFHTHCANNSDTLERTLQVVEEKFKSVFPSLKWINFGGGHHITRADYDVEKLISLIVDFKKRYNLEVYLEPGEAVGWQTGPLIASVLDIVHNEIDIAILDTSFAAHMPDCLEMPYRPEVRDAGKAGQYPHQYRFGGISCLAGDVVGDYSFPTPLEIGSKVIFEDMIHYTIVKNNTFNGIRLPSIAIWREETGLEIIRRFGYEDYKNRLS